MPVRTRAGASVFEVCVIEVFVSAEFEANRRVPFEPYRLWPGDISGDHVQTLGQCEPVVGLVGLYDNVVGIDALADTVVAGPDVRHVDPLKGRGEAVDVLPALGYAHAQVLRARSARLAKVDVRVPQLIPFQARIGMQVRSFLDV